MTTNKEYIDEYITSRGLTQNTRKTITIILKHYSNHQESSLDELLQEADIEEEQGIRWKRRKLKKRLTNYMNYCRETMLLSSANKYLTTVKGFYTHHEIEIHQLPAFNKKTGNISEPIQYADLPDKEIIQKALEISQPVMKAVILFQLSTGMAKVDTLKLTISDFIKATYDYHKTTDIEMALQKLKSIDNPIIPSFKLRRQKNNKYFITFCTPEATIEILHYLTIRDNRRKLQPNDPLFKINQQYYQRQFSSINAQLKLGKKGTYNRFRGHLLRKFHASNLEREGMDRYKINVLQGKSNGAVDDVYFFEDEVKLREEYIKHMQGLLIYTETLTVDSPEVIEIKNENRILKEQLSEMAEVKNEIQKIKDIFNIME